MVLNLLNSETKILSFDSTLLSFYKPIKKSLSFDRGETSIRKVEIVYWTSFVWLQLSYFATLNQSRYPIILLIVII